jgi:small subunit ribosomal protein S4e
MHLKRLNTPKIWNISKKSTTFVAKSKPGPHAKEMSLPLIVLLREHLNIVENKKEAKALLNEKRLKVDCKVVNELNYPIGLFDTISIPDAAKYYRLCLDYKGGLILIPIDEKEAELKFVRVINKTRLKKGLVQFNLSGGRNLISKEKYGIGDTIIFDLNKNKAVKKLELKKEALVLVIKGKHAGEIARIEGFKEFESITKDRVILKNKEGATYQTMKDYAFVIGESKEELKISELNKK